MDDSVNYMQVVEQDGTPVVDTPAGEITITELPITPELEACTPSDCSSCEGSCCGNPKQELPENVDPTISFDKTRQHRVDALTEAVTIVGNLDKGQKVSPKKTIAVFKDLVNHAIFLDELVVSMLQEMYKMAELIATREVDTFNIQASLKAIIIGLGEKNVITDKELSDIFNKEVSAAFPKKEEVKEEV